MVVHTWDLAVAIGQNPEWDQDVVAVAFEAIQHGLPAGNRAAVFAEFFATMPPEMPAMGAPFAEALAINSAAPTIDRLVAWNGRNPAMLETSQR